MPSKLVTLSLHDALPISGLLKCLQLNGYFGLKKVLGKVVINGGVFVQRQDLRDVLIRPDNHNSTLSTVQTSQVVNILADFQTRNVAKQHSVGLFSGEDLFVVFESELALGRLQQAGNVVDVHVEMLFLGDGVHVKNRIGFGVGSGEPVDRAVSVGGHTFTPAANR